MQKIVRSLGFFLVLGAGISVAGCEKQPPLGDQVAAAIRDGMREVHAKLDTGLGRMNKIDQKVDAVIERLDRVEANTACLKCATKPATATTKPVGVIRPAAPRATAARNRTRKPTAKPTPPPVQTAQAAPAPPTAPSMPLRMQFPAPPPFQPSQNAAQFQERERKQSVPVSAPEPQKKRRWWQPNRPSVCDNCPCDCKTRS